MDKPSYIFLKYRDTPPSSLIGYLMMLATEMKEKAQTMDASDEQFWYYDAASLITEVMYRYENFRIRDELSQKGDRTVYGVLPKRVDSDR